ncbi:MAG: hypothetical protein O3A84_05175 [Proteobacteria bacterium]|nr:hypothetical protein [Pseudomonadota bacterium]
MKIRQEREARARADQARARAEVEKKKAGRALKLAGLWIGLIIVIFFAAVWFSPDFVNWLHDMVN